MNSLNRVLLLFMLFFTTLFSEPINIAFDYNKPPFIFGKVGAKGIEPDIIKRVFDNLGYRVQPTQIPKFYLGKILSYSKDFNASLVLRAENKSYYYSNIVIPYEYVAITPKNRGLKINSIKDLTKLQFITYSGAYRELGDKFRIYFNPRDGLYKNNYNEAQSYKEAFERFVNGEYNVLILEKSIFKWYKKFLKDENSYNFYPIFKGKYGSKLAFYSKELRDLFNQALTNFKETKEYKQIVKYYKNHNLYPLLKFINLLSDISSKYIYEQKSKRVKNILYKFLINAKDIISIEISSNNLKSNSFKLSKVEPNIKLDTISSPLYYKFDGTSIKIGSIKVEYKRDSNFLENRLFLPISSFNNLNRDDLKELERLYKKYHIPTDNLYRVSLTKRERLWLKSKKVINVYINSNNYTPYIICNDDKIDGIIPSYLKLFGSKLGVKFNIIDKDKFNSKTKNPKKQNIDIVIDILNSRKYKNYYFTSKIDSLKIAIFSNERQFNSISDLNKMRVAIIKGSFIEDYLKRRYPNIKIKSYPNIVSSINAVLNKEVDALIDSYDVVNYIMNKYNLYLSYSSLIDDISNTVQLAIIKSEPILKEILDKAIESISLKQREEIKDRWLKLSKNDKLHLTDKQKSYLKRLNSLRYCINPNWTPIEFLKDNTPQGISIDTLKIIADRLNKPLKYIPTDSWYMSQEYLRLGKCDILPSAIRTKEREEYALFTKPYLHYPIAIITRKESPVVMDIDTLSNRSMSRKKGSGLGDILKERYPNLKIINTNGYMDAINMVKSKEVYFTVSTLPILSEYRNRYGLNGLKIAGYLDLKMNLSMAVNKRKRVLYEIIDKALATIPAETHKLINDKWTSAPREIKKIDYSLVKKIISLFGLIIIIIFIAYLAQYRANRKIKQLNRALEETNRELERVNSTLEEKIKIEVAKNLEKDRIMLAQNRLAKMGEMIAMIAHQWRQPLNNLSILIQSLALSCQKEGIEKYKIDNFHKRSLELIEQMSKTIDDFRNFFKPDKQKSLFSVNRVINDLYFIINPILKNQDINLIIDAKEEIKLEGYPNEFGQALLNLINNAKDAIIERDAEVKEIRVEAKREKDKVLISVEDYAGGIESDIIDKIYEPYFSTKDSKNGTGLGLYIAKMVIEKHMNGELRVLNTEKGVRFEIVFSINEQKN